MDATKEEREFWERAYCAYVSAGFTYLGNEVREERAGEVADASLEQWRSRFAKPEQKTLTVEDLVPRKRYRVRTYPDDVRPIQHTDEWDCSLQGREFTLDPAYCEGEGYRLKDSWWVHASWLEPIDG